jgi:hypothetical protein
VAANLVIIGLAEFQHGIAALFYHVHAGFLEKTFPFVAEQRDGL